MNYNKKEHLLHTACMVAGMALVMSFFNIALHNGFSRESVEMTWLSFPLTFLVAFVLEYYIVGKQGMKVAFKLHRGHHTPLQKRMIISLCIVPLMAASMSLYGAILRVGFSTDMFATWGKSFLINAIVAYIVVLFVVGPLVGIAFHKIFPKGTIVDIEEK